jgi:hypothetical protein
LPPFSVLNSVSSHLNFESYRMREIPIPVDKVFRVNVVRIAFCSQFVCSEYLLDKKVIICVYSTNPFKCKGRGSVLLLFVKA